MIKGYFVSHCYYFQPRTEKLHEKEKMFTWEIPADSLSVI